MLRALIGLTVSVALSHAAEIGPGSAAPPLDIKTWYKGKPIKALEKNKTYVIEFWATWCGPCIQAMPHLSKLARANKDVTFIGVAIWQPDKGNVIKDFVRDMGVQMDYAVGYSGDREQGMGVTWMNPAAQIGIPATFIVKNGIIEWIGHPMGLDEPLQQIKTGTFDRKAFKAEFDKRAIRDRQWIAARPEATRLMGLIRVGKYAEAKSGFIKLGKKYPAARNFFDQRELEAAYKEDPSRWEELVQDITESRDLMRILNLMSVVWRLAQPGADVARLTNTVELCIESLGDKNPYVLSTAASYFEKINDKARALALAEKALAGIPTSEYKDNKYTLEEFTNLRDRLKKSG